ADRWDLRRGGDRRDFLNFRIGVSVCRTMPARHGIDDCGPEHDVRCGLVLEPWARSYHSPSLKRADVSWTLRISRRQVKNVSPHRTRRPLAATIRGETEQRAVRRGL